MIKILSLIATVVVLPLLRVPLLPLVEVVVHLLRLHSHLETSPVTTQFTVGPIVTTNLALTMSKYTSKIEKMKPNAMLCFVV